MRRRLQGIKPADCTDLKILGRRNRYLLATSAETGTPVVDNEPVSMAPESGNGGRFPAALLDLGAEHLNSSRRNCVTYIFPGGSAPVFYILNIIENND